MISHVYRRMHPDEPSKTIIAAGGGGTWGYHYPEPRAFTNRERARIQSFPDNFEFIGTTTEVRRQIGNAVPPQGVYELAKPFYQFLAIVTKKSIYMNVLRKKKAPIFKTDLIRLKVKNGTYFSNFSPAKITNKSLQDTWLKLFKSADEVLIATGYISNDSIEDLHSILQQNPDFIKIFKY